MHWNPASGWSWNSNHSETSSNLCEGVTNKVGYFLRTRERGRERGELYSFEVLNYYPQKPTIESGAVCPSKHVAISEVYVEVEMLNPPINLQMRHKVGVGIRSSVSESLPAKIEDTLRFVMM